MGSLPVSPVFNAPQRPRPTGNLCPAAVAIRPLVERVLMEGNILAHLIRVDSALLLVATVESIIEVIDHIPLGLGALQTSRDNGEILKDSPQHFFQRTANWIPNHWLAESSQWQRQVLLYLPCKPCKQQSLFIWVSDFLRPKTAMEKAGCF